MSVEGLPRYAYFPTERADPSLRFPHCCLRKAHLGRSHFGLASAGAAPRSRSGKTGSGSFRDQLALELRECSEYSEHQLSGRGRRIDGCTLACKHAQADAFSLKVLHGIDEVSKIAAQPIQFPHHESVPAAQSLDARRQAWPVVVSTRGVVLVDVLSRDACCQQGIPLEVQGLTAV